MFLLAEDSNSRFRKSRSCPNACKHRIATRPLVTPPFRAEGEASSSRPATFVRRWDTYETRQFQCLHHACDPYYKQCTYVQHPTSLSPSQFRAASRSSKTSCLTPSYRGTGGRPPRLEAPGRGPWLGAPTGLRPPGLRARKLRLRILGSFLGFFWHGC